METGKLIEKIRESALKAGFSETGMLDISRLQYDPAIRRICEENTCHGYNKSWACPPAVGSLDQCRDRCERFAHMLLLSCKYELEDSFDFEGMKDGMLRFKERIEAFDRDISEIAGEHLLLSNEGCGRCVSCTWPDAPCRFPNKLYHSIEGYGFNVSALAKDAGIKYNNGRNTVTFFGALLFGKKE